MTRSRTPAVSEGPGETHGVGGSALAAAKKELVTGTVDNADDGTGVSTLGGLVEELLEL